MNAIVRDVMTTQVVAVKRNATFKEMATTLRRFRVSGVVAVRDRLSYPDENPSPWARS